MAMEVMMNPNKHLMILNSLDLIYIVMYMSDQVVVYMTGQVVVYMTGQVVVYMTGQIFV